MGLYEPFLYLLGMLHWFGAETWIITQNLKPENGCVIEKLSSPSSKEDGSIVFSRDVENCLGTINMCLFWISLTMETLSADCYGGTLSLWQPFFAKGLSFFTRVLSICMTMPGIIHPAGLTAIYGCTSDRLWISPKLALSLHAWEAPGWQVIVIDADVKQGITSWLQTLNSSVFTLE